MTGGDDAIDGPGRADGEGGGAHGAVRHDRAAPDGSHGPPRAHDHRQGRSPLTVALVAGAVLVAGGGVYGATALSGPSPLGTVRPAPAPLAITGGTASGPQGPGGPVTVTGVLPDGPGTAPVYVPGGPVAREQVERLAAALRVPGGVVSGDGGWRVAPEGGRPGPVLRVAQDAPGGWAYVRAGAGASCEPSASGPGGAHRSVCHGPGPAAQQGEKPVPQAAARKAAAPVLAALGLGGAAVDTSRTTGAVREVAVDPVVGGLPTSGWRTTLQIGPDGTVLSASGRLVTLTRGAEYPVVSAGQAVDGLRHTGGGARLCGGGVAHPDTGSSGDRTNGATAGGGVTNGQAPAGAGTANGPAPGGSGTASAAPPEGVGVTSGSSSDRTNGGPAASGLPRQNLPCLSASPAPRVDGAVFGLSAQIVAGRAQLVPSWLLTVERPGVSAPSVLAVPAVDPAFVSVPSAPGTASGVPVPQPSGGGTPAERVTSYTVDGRTVTLRFWGGVCSDYSAHVVAQDSGSVRVRITAVPKGDPHRPCPMIAKSLTEKVTLDRPLDGRALYDASSGHRVPAAKS